MINYIRPALIPAFIFCMSGSMAADDPAGEWLVKDKTAHIRILHCDQKLWGIISWTKTPDTDRHNPDAARRARPILGLPILRGMEPKAGGGDGNIYNADNGKMYKGSVRLKSEDVLHVEGCVWNGFLCGGEDWTRLKAASASDASDNTCEQID